MSHAPVQQKEENVPASLSSVFLNLLPFFFVVLKGLNLPAFLVFRGNSLFILCASQSYSHRFLPETIVIIVTGVLKYTYYTDKIHGSEL